MDQPSAREDGPGLICPKDRIATHSDDGVDLTLIRWMLSLTPNERLEVLQHNVEAILELRDANPQL